MADEKIDQLIDAMERTFCAQVVDEDAAIGTLEALYLHLSDTNSHLSSEQEQRIDDIQARFRAGPGRFKSEPV